MNGVPVATRRLPRLRPPLRCQRWPPLWAKMLPERCAQGQSPPTGCRDRASDTSLTSDETPRCCRFRVPVPKTCRFPCVTTLGRPCLRKWPEWILYLLRLICQDKHPRPFFLHPIHVTPVSLKPRVHQPNYRDPSMTFLLFTVIPSPRGSTTRCQASRLVYLNLLGPSCLPSKMVPDRASHRPQNPRLAKCLRSAPTS